MLMQDAGQLRAALLAVIGGQGRGFRDPGAGELFSAQAERVLRATEQIAAQTRDEPPMQRAHRHGAAGGQGGGTCAGVEGDGLAVAAVRRLGLRPAQTPSDEPRRRRKIAKLRRQPNAPCRRNPGRAARLLDFDAASHNRVRQSACGTCS